MEEQISKWFNSTSHDMGKEEFNQLMEIISSSSDPAGYVAAHKDLGDIVEHCAGTLPDRWIIGIGIENGAAWVEIFDQDGDKVEPPDSVDRTLSEQVFDALQLAIDRTT